MSFGFAMEQRSSDGSQPAEWTAGSRRNYLKCLVAALRQIPERSRTEKNMSITGRSRAVKFAADLSLAMTARGTTWSRSILAQSRKNSPNFIDFVHTCRPRIWSKKPKSISIHKISRRCKASDEWRRSFLRIRGDFHSISRSGGSNAKMLLKTSPRARRLNVSSKKSVRRLLRAVSRSSKRRAEIRTVDSRLKTLKRLVPGGRAMDTPVLLQEVADYILALKLQVETMQTLANYFSNSGADLTHT
eukprot:Gb_01289 [translate_table: standard]